ncbi:hypothetical protein HZC53_00420 [Candidatus Uhrbacteria bacterium]|nr:hypothetical protein [Candidatus Uhrbacteria bacterium]
MALSIPSGSRLMPLTKERFEALVAKSETPGVLKAVCTKFLPPPIMKAVCEAGDKTGALRGATTRADFLLHPLEPDTAKRYGSGFITFYHHATLIEWLVDISGNHDFSLTLNLTADDDGFQARCTSEYHKRLNDVRLGHIPFAGEDEPEISWDQTPHSPEFIARTLPVLFEEDEEEFTGVHGEWTWHWATTPCEGMFIMHGDQRMLAVYNPSRFPNRINGARILGNNALAVDISPRGNEDEKARLMAEINRFPNLYRDHLVESLTGRYGFKLPAIIEERIFLWQRFLDASLTPKRLC